MGAGNRSVSSDFIFGLIVVVFTLSVIITMVIFFPEGGMKKQPNTAPINPITEGKIIRIEEKLI